MTERPDRKSEQIHTVPGTYTSTGSIIQPTVKPDTLKETHTLLTDHEKAVLETWQRKVMYHERPSIRITVKFSVKTTAAKIHELTHLRGWVRKSHKILNYYFKTPLKST